MKGHRHIHLVYVLFFGVLLAAFYQIYLWNQNTQNFNEFHARLLELRKTEVQMERDLLRVSSLQLIHYDQLALLISDIFHQSQKIDQLSRIDSPGWKKISQSFQPWAVKIQNRIEEVEYLKQEAAKVRNSVFYLPTVVAQLEQWDQVLYVQALNVLSWLNTYLVAPSAELKQKILDQIDRLAQLEPSAGSKLLRESAVFHMRAAIHSEHQLTRITDRFFAYDSEREFDQVLKVFDEIKALETRDMEFLSVFLVLVALALLFGTWVLNRRLNRAHKVSVRNAERLHDAVESLGDGFALFDEDKKLILSNSQFERIYPWLKGLCSTSDVVWKTFERASQQHSKSREEFESDDERDGDHGFLEHNEQGRWILSRNFATSEGGIACVRTDITRSKLLELELIKLGQALEQSPASVIITNTDGDIEYVNPKLIETSGYQSEELIGQNPRIFKGGDKDQVDYQRMWDTLLAGEEWRGVFHNKKKDGSFYWESASISAIKNEHGEIVNFISVKEDITEKILAEEQLHLNSVVFDTSAEGIMIANSQGQIISVNPSFEKITGYRSEEVLGKNPRFLNSGRQDKAFYGRMWKQILAIGQWSGEIWNRKKDGSVYPEWLSIVAIKDRKGKTSEYIAVFSDISSRKDSEEKIRYQANYDALTDLPNRTLFNDRLAHLIEQSANRQNKFALLFIDLDRFKFVNDTFGHITGDAVLVKAANRLKAVHKARGTVARFGGDEFVMLIEDIDRIEVIADEAEQIINEMTRPFHLLERDIVVGASVGVAIYPQDGENAEILLSNADIAMYKAKEQGRNRFQFFEGIMQSEMQERLALEQDLRKALSEQQLELYYQPVVDALTERVVSAEALIRWNHPTKGLVFPDEFIPLAEEIGLIEEIGAWVLAEACKYIGSRNQNNPDPLFIAVNVSSRQFEQGFDENYLKNLQSRYGCDPAWLTLEITESLMVKNTGEAIARIDALKKNGVRIAIDDFGTGYSSLSYLKQMNVDVVKIDQSFVSGIGTFKEDEQLIEAIIAMANAFGLKTVAEGVESAEQKQFLRDHGCDYLQGYLFDRAIPAVELEKRLSSKP